MTVFDLTLEELEDAAKLVHEFVPPTPQHQWPLIDEALGTRSWLKHENHTGLGAFKIRGGIVYLHHLMEPEPPSALAAARSEKDDLAGQRVGIVVTGGNVDRDVFARTLA